MQVESMRIQISWLDLDEVVGEEVEGTMNQQDVQLPMSSLLVNQMLQCMLEQMITLTMEKQQFKVPLNCVGVRWGI